MVFFKLTLICQQCDIIPLICHRCHWHRWQIGRWGRWYRQQFATGALDTGGKFAASTVSMAICHRCRWYRWQICHRCRWHRRKFAAGVVDTCGAPSLANISANFQKNFKGPKSYFHRLGGRWFIKNWSIKFHDIFPLSIKERKPWNKNKRNSRNSVPNPPRKRK